MREIKILSRHTNLGAAMTEYIPVIVSIALVALLSIGRLGDVTGDQGASIATELGGGNGSPPQLVSNNGFPNIPSGGGTGSSSNNTGGTNTGGTNTGGTNTGGINTGGTNTGGTNTGGTNTGGTNTGGTNTGGTNTGGTNTGGTNTGGTNTGGNSTSPDPVEENTEPETPPLLSVAGLVEFGQGLWAGARAQGEGLLQLVLNPIESVEAFYTLGKALIADPEGTLATIRDEFNQDLESVLSGDAYEIGRIIGENVSPATVLNIAKRVSSIARRVDDDGRSNVNGCTRASSFSGDTLIITDQGLKPIKDIRVGNLVWSRNDVTFEDSYQEVTELLTREVDHYYDVTVQQTIIRTTEEHPFWKQGAGWVVSQNLLAGDILAAVSGDLELRNLARVDQPLQVYNFVVATNHSYFVSEYGLWVHNPTDGGVCDLSKSVAYHDLSNQKLGREGDSTVLRDNLAAVGTKPKPNHAAHHIVPKGPWLKYPVVAKIQDMLKKEGIDINEASNGVYLPCNRGVACPPAETHSLLHKKGYFDAILDRLERMPEGGNMRDEIIRIGEQLEQGTFVFDRG